MRFPLLAVGFSLTWCACGAPAPTTGSVQLRFSVAESVRSSSSLKDPLVGTIYGSLFLTEDVGIAGPREGATAVADVPATAIDVRTEMLDKGAVVIDKLAPGTYTFLGFFDLDNNPGTPPRPDSGDPACFPRTNEFAITLGNQSKRLILFDLLYN